MDQLFSVVGLGGVPYSKSRRDDDYADRMNHRTTVALFVCFALLVSTKQFVGNPINCWMPAHFDKDSHDEYTNRLLLLSLLLLLLLLVLLLLVLLLTMQRLE